MNYGGQRPDFEHLFDGMALHSTRPFLLGEACWSYADALEASRRIAGSLVGFGIRPGDRVVMIGDNRAELILLALGAAWAGAIFCVLHPELTDGSLRGILDRVQPRLVIGRGRPVPIHGPWTCLETDDALPALIEGAIAPLARCKAEDTLCLVFTSGSSGEPRGVVVSRANVAFSASAIQERLRYAADDVIGLFLPLSFDYALYQIFLALQVGAALWIGRTEHIGPRWLRTVAESRISVLPLTPGLIGGLLKLLDRRHENLPHLRSVTSTGDHLAAADIGALERHFPRLRVYPMYGLTECKRVSIGVPEDGPSHRYTVGRPLTGTTVDVIDDKGCALAAGAVGQLRVSGPHVTHGYWCEPEATRRSFQIGGDGCRRLLTGDVGRLDEEGCIEVLGRHDGMLKHHGFRISAAEIESAARRVDAVMQACVVRHPARDELHLFCQIGSGPVTEKDILGCLRDQLERFKIPECVHLVQHLPWTSTGKLDRAAMRRTLQPS